MNPLDQGKCWELSSKVVNELITRGGITEQHQEYYPGRRYLTILELTELDNLHQELVYVAIDSTRLSQGDICEVWDYLIERYLILNTFKLKAI
jgi:hypothetical protein